MNDGLFSRSPEEVVNRITKRVLYPGAFFLAAALISGSSEAVLGLVFGLSISLLLFRLKLVHSRRALRMDKERAKKFIRNRMVANYFIFFVVLMVAQWQPGLDLLAAVLGLLLLKFTILASALLELIRNFFADKKEEYSLSPLSVLRKDRLKEEYLNRGKEGDIDIDIDLELDE